MSDEKFNEEASIRLEYYLSLNGISIGDDFRSHKFSLVNNGNGTEIHNWQYDIELPTKEQLMALPIEETRKLQKRKRMCKDMLCVCVLTQLEIDDISSDIPNGSIFINETTGKLNGKVKGSIIEL